MSAHFEQDRTYNDLDGNLKNFTIRDYSKAKGISMTPTSTEESRTATQKAYDESTWEVVDMIIEENPAIFAREFEEAIDIVDDRIEWNRNALFYIVKESRDYSTLKIMLTKNIIEHLGYAQCPPNYLDDVDSFRKKYKETQTI